MLCRKRFLTSLSKRLRQRMWRRGYFESSGIRHLIVSALRGAGKNRHLEDAGSEHWLIVNLDSQLDAATVADSLKELDADLRVIITARIWGELSFQQIGELRGTSSSTAHRRYVEGLELLREKLGATCPKND